MQEIILKAFLKLKNSLSTQNEKYLAARMEATAHNAWFTPEFIDKAAQAICQSYLNENALRAFVSQYVFANQTKKIGIIMAGNIPMVGFHDLLCVLLSGHLAYIKLSSKDAVLMKYIISSLSSYDMEIKNRILVSEDGLKNCDAYIATGSNLSNVYFKYYFEKYPHILRSSKSSVAILSGDESEEELALLSDDIFLFFGLGCRNVSKIYVPENYNFQLLINAFQKYHELVNLSKYKNNLDYQLSLLILNQQVYMSSENLLLIEHKSFAAPIGVLHYEFYKDKDELISNLQDKNEIQAIVAKDFTPFGAAQKPLLNDFADGIDTMQFLSNGSF